MYNYTDHLGNIRLGYSKPQTEPLKILEESHYYPFGMKHLNYGSQKNRYVLNPDKSPMYAVLEPVERSDYQYKYNGKELQDELSLNWYDYQARNYDPAIGRWMNIDPKSETSRRWSPYTYCYNNPMYFVDPDGMEADDWKKTATGDYVFDANLTKENASTQLKEGEKYLGQTATLHVLNTETGQETGTYTLNKDGSATDAMTGENYKTGGVDLGTGQIIDLPAPDLTGVAPGTFDTKLHDSDNDGRVDTFSVGDYSAYSPNPYPASSAKQSDIEEFGIGDILSNLASSIFGKAGGSLLETSELNSYEVQKATYESKQKDSLHLRQEAQRYKNLMKIP